MQIQRYPLAGLYSGPQTVYMPSAAEIIKVDVIQNIPYIWAAIDEYNTAPFAYRNLQLSIDGMSIPGTIKKYLGKIGTNDWTYYHVLELMP